MSTKRKYRSQDEIVANIKRLQQNLGLKVKCEGCGGMFGKSEVNDNGYCQKCGAAYRDYLEAKGTW